MLVLGRLGQGRALLVQHEHAVVRDVGDEVQILLGPIDAEEPLGGAGCKAGPEGGEGAIIVED